MEHHRPCAAVCSPLLSPSRQPSGRSIGLSTALFLAGSAVFLSGLLSGCTVALAQTAPDTGPGFWKILDTRAVGADAYLKRNPTHDGRGAVIAVLDTGVDMLRPGLKTTSDGKVKVIEARDFSGQGEIGLQVAEIKTFDKVKYLSTDEGKVRGYEKLPKQAKAGEWFVGFLTESSFANSEVNDINQNGSTTDVFAVVTVPDGEGWIAYVDLDGNGDISDATPMKGYSIDHKPFIFPLRDPEFQRPPVSFALEIDESGTIVTFHFDDGGHGTHVAGIAAGHGLMGRKGFNGIAPGAQVMSLKVGDNTLSGGATTTDSMYQAITFAGKWSEKHKRAVVINISYGIGSEIEGESVIDTALDSALTTYPLLSASVSAGNEGPGLSTVGTPAASHLATSVAAMLPKATSEALFGRRAATDRIFSFSSRGGEIPKPDVLAPGIASSSVPVFDDGDIKGGTSMAAPEIAGVYALMVSAAVSRKLRFNGSTLKRALLHSARQIPGYPLFSQGAGLPNVGRAVDALAKLSKRKSPFKLAGYYVSTGVPTSVSRTGQAAFWRTGTYLPPDNKGHKFRIEAVFRDGITAEERASFQTMLAFKSEAGWLNIDRRSGRLLGDNGLDVHVTYDRGDLKKPGVYSSRVLVTPDDSAGISAFSLWNTIVVPHTFTAANNYRMADSGSRLKPGEIKRYPLLVPPGATSMTIDANVPKGSWGSTVLQLFDPSGRPFAISQRHASSEFGTTARALVQGRDLTAGTWELVTYASWRNRSESRTDVEVRFRGLSAAPIRTVQIDAGEQPYGKFNVTNRYDVPFDGQAMGTFKGFRRVRTPD
ncbi:MAG: tripeptidyl-peptidase-2, partial [Myxococcota bacterium]